MLKPRTLLGMSLALLCVLGSIACGGATSSGTPPTPQQLSITTTQLPDGQVQTSYQTVVAATGGATPYSWALTGGQLPPGLTLATATGQISGMPTQTGNYSLTVTVQDSSTPSPQSVAKTFSINISSSGPSPLTITTTALPTGVVGQAYSATLLASGGTPAYSWSITSGQLPPGLTLAAASGQITGTPTQAGPANFTARVQDSSQPAQSASKALTLTVVSGNLDQYGGLLSITSPSGATGYWRVEKFGNRWLFVTPDGHGFWSFGVFNIVPGGAAAAKYGDQDLTWGPQAVRRLRSWGFNTILDHSNKWVRPTTTNNNWPGDHSNPEKMASVGFQDGALYPLRNNFNYAPQGTKDIFNGLNRTYYSGYLAPNPDPFDPNFSIWINTWMQSHADAIAWGNSPWVIGFSLAEADNIFGFGAGASGDFQSVPPGHNNPHLGWIVLITSPTQTSNSLYGTYTDTTVYAKLALRDFLQQRYNNTIATLNAAWGSSYTTFDSAGGWGPGTGLLDEDGRHSWVPRDWDNLNGATAAMKQDLDDFLYQYAVQWFKTQRDALKARYPNMLYLGPNVVGTWGTPPRRQILQAAGQYIDVFMTRLGVGTTDDQQRLDFVMQHLGDKPLASWLGIPANPDSAMYQYPNPGSAITAQTQVERGQKYTQILDWYVNATNPAGTHPFVGMRWWAWVDSTAESTNWGLVSLLDNAYDGLEAVIPLGTDPWGYPTGGEDNNYGDFLSAVKAASQAILQSLP